MFSSFAAIRVRSSPASGRLARATSQLLVNMKATSGCLALAGGREQGNLFEFLRLDQSMVD